MSVKLLNTPIKYKLRSEFNIYSCDAAITELVLNSLDANASSIAVRVNLRSYRLQVVDDGNGICESDMSLIGQRFMTNKCRSIPDLNSNLNKFGFRGEALASLVVLSEQLKIESLEKTCNVTVEKKFFKGIAESYKIIENKRSSHGTTVTIDNFMYNMKVRQKRIHHIHEIEKIKTAIETIALVNHDVSFTLRDDYDGTILLRICKSKSVEQAFTNIFDINEENVLQKMSNSYKEYKIDTLFANYGHSTNYYQFVYVNQRYIIHTKIYKIFNKILKTKITLNDKEPSKQPVSKTYPIFILNIVCPFNLYDITLMPDKSKIWFKNWNHIIKLIDGLFDKSITQDSIQINKGDTKQGVEEVINAALQKNSNYYHATQMGNVVKGKPAKRLLKKPKDITKQKRRINQSIQLTDPNSQKRRIIQNIQLTDPNSPSDNKSGLVQKESIEEKLHRKISSNKYISNIVHGNVNFNSGKNKDVIKNDSISKKISMDFSENTSDSIIEKQKNIQNWIDRNASLNNNNYDSNKTPMNKIKKSTNLDKRLIENKVLKKVLFNNHKYNIINSNDGLSYFDSLQKEYNRNNKNEFQEGFFNYVNNTWKELKKSHKVKNTHLHNDYTNITEKMHKNVHNSVKNRNKLNNNIAFMKKSTELFINNVHVPKNNESNNRISRQKPLTTYSLIKTVESMNMKKTNIKLKRVQKLAFMEQSQKTYVSHKKMRANNIYNHKQQVKFDKTESSNEFIHYYNAIKNITEMNDSSKSVKVIDSVLKSNVTKFNFIDTLRENKNNFMRESSVRIENNNSIGRSILNFTYEEIDVPNNSNKTMFQNEEKMAGTNRFIQNKKSHIEDRINDRFNQSLLNLSRKNNGLNRQIRIKTANKDENDSSNAIQKNINMSRDLFSDQSSIQTMDKNKYISESNVYVEDFSEKDDEPSTNLSIILVEVCENETKDKEVEISENEIKDKKVEISENETKDKEIEISENETKDEEVIENGIKNNEMVVSNNETKDNEMEISKNETENKEVQLAPNNMNQNNYIVCKRPSFIPKGMSPILKMTEVNLKSVHKNVCENNERLDQDGNINWGKNYYGKELYETFMRNVADNSTTFGIEDVGKMMKIQNFQVPLIYKKEMLSSVRVINQVDNKFIASVVENEKQKYLVMFDQHAVDERINLERLLRNHYDGTSWKSTAYSRKYSKNQLNVDLLVEYQKGFKSLGITFDISKDGNEISINTIPACLNLGNKKKSIIDQYIDQVFDEEINVLINTRGNVNKLPDAIMDVLASEACHTAIKFGKPLSKQKCQKLITALSKCEMPFQCAHGRPLIATLINLNETAKKKNNKINLKKLKCIAPSK